MRADIIVVASVAYDVLVLRLLLHHTMRWTNMKIIWVK